MSTVSVVIPVFNNQDTLERAVSSVIQEPQVSEVILVDDGSKDLSFSVAENIAAKHAIVRLLFHPSHANKGAAASRNLGLAHSLSDWIQFLDADDELLPGKLAAQVDLATEGISLVVGNSIHVFPDGRRHFRKSDQDIWKGLIRSKLGDTCANLWNKARLLAVGGWDEQLGSSQEYDMMFRLLSRFPKVAFDSCYMTLIHKMENSISTCPQRREQRIRNWLGLRERIRGYLVQKDAFTLKYRYCWSGAVGLYCIESQVQIPANVNPIYLWIYGAELNAKKNIHRMVRTELATQNWR